jgi:hypothetical protein
VVECDLAKVEVAGSNPVSRSSFWKPCPGEGFSFYTCRFRELSGAVAKW